MDAAHYVRNLANFEDTETTLKEMCKYAKKNKARSIVVYQHNNTRSYIEVYFTAVMYAHEFDTYNAAVDFLESTKAFKGMQASVRIFGQKTETVVNCGISLERIE